LSRRFRIVVEYDGIHERDLTPVIRYEFIELQLLFLQTHPRTWAVCILNQFYILLPEAFRINTQRRITFEQTEFSVGILLSIEAQFAEIDIHVAI
jgi:hypothetical protein